MNWIKEHRFLTGFFAFIAIGALVLAYLLYSAWGEYAQVDENYKKQAAELQRLQALQPFPDAANLKKFQEEKDTFAEAMTGLQKSLAAMEVPLEPNIKPNEFQDQLRKSVSDIGAKAAQNHVKLPDKFYLGFDRYQTEPPAGPAAPPLARELKAIELIMNTVLESKVDALTVIRRAPLPEEGGPAKPLPKGADKTKPVLVLKYPIEIAFSGDQSRFRNVLNKISSAQRQFFIIRALHVQNSNQKSPPREAAPPPGSPAPAGEAGAPAGQQPGGAPKSDDSRKLIVGNELVEVTMRIEMVDFADTLPK